MKRIIPSIASSDQLRVADQILRTGSWPYLHIDMEDGNFIPNITFGMKMVNSIASFALGKELDAHLMVTNPGDYIPDLLKAGVKKIAFHIEAAPYPGVYLQMIHEQGGCAGIAFNFQADLKQVLPYKDSIDYLLIMTSEPDRKGQKFTPYIIEKIKEAGKIFPPRVQIMVDGGVSEENMKELSDAGTSEFVMGRAIWSASDPEKRIHYLSDKLNRRWEKGENPIIN